MTIKNTLIKGAVGLAALTLLTYKIATIPAASELKGDENIKYIGTDQDYTTQIAVVRNSRIDVLMYDKEGNKLEDIESMPRASYIGPNPTNSILKKPALSEIVNDFSKDFPLGTVFIKMYDDAKAYQNSLN